ALSLSGRFSVMVRICSATSYLIVSYAIGVSSRLCFLTRHSGTRVFAWTRNLEILRCAIAHRSSRFARPGMTVELFCRRRRPRLLRSPQALERLRHPEHAEIVEAAADDLD